MRSEIHRKHPVELQLIFVNFTPSSPILINTDAKASIYNNMISKQYTPMHLQQQNQTTSRNSIFPVSETGLFEEISIHEVPTHLQSHENDQKHQAFECNKSWEWFAYIYSPVQFHSVAVPRNPSSRVQATAVLPEQLLLCAKLGQDPHSRLWLYSMEGNVLMDVPKMQCEDRNLIGSACALPGGWLYVDGGYKGSLSCVEPAAYLNLAERLNLKTWQWQALPPMQKPLAFATGLDYNNKF